MAEQLGYPGRIEYKMANIPCILCNVEFLTTVEHEVTHLAHHSATLVRFVEQKRRSRQLDVEPILCGRIEG